MINAVQLILKEKKSYGDALCDFIAMHNRELCLKLGMWHLHYVENTASQTNSVRATPIKKCRG